MPALTSLGITDIVPSVRNAASAAIYESGSTSRRGLAWRAPTASPNAAILSSLATIRDRSRSATRNNGFAKGAIDKLVTNIIGTGIKPQPLTADIELRKQIQDAWLRWTDESDADGLLDWYGQQAQAVRGWLEGGEVFIRIRPRLLTDGLIVPLQVQVLEPELCPYTHNVYATKGNRIRAGIEFDSIGRRVAYWFHPSRPGDLMDFDASQLRRVPADSVIHLFDPLRPGQLRGVPHLTQALVKLNELDKFDDATLLRQQLANLFVAFLTRMGNDDALHPLTGEALEDPAESQLPQMEPALLQALNPGEDIKFSTPPGTSDGYRDFMRQQLFAIAAATGVPYEALTGDMSGVNDRTVRVIFNEFRLRIQTIQHQIVAHQVCRQVWNAWVTRAYLANVLPIAPGSPEAAVRWTPPRTPYIHPVQDVEAQQAAIRAGLTSRSAIVSELGEDAEAIDEQQATDNARADEHRLRYDSDARYAKSGTAAGARTPIIEQPDEQRAGAAA